MSFEVLTIITIVFLCITALGMMLFVTYQLPVLRYSQTTLNVDGFMIDENQILQQVDSYHDCFMAFLPLEEIEKKLSVTKQIKHVSVHRNWPNTLELDIVLHQPSIVVAAGRVAVYLDKEGHPFPCNEEPMGDIPVFEVIPSDEDSELLEPQKTLTRIYQSIIQITNMEHPAFKQFRLIDGTLNGELHFQNPEMGISLRLRNNYLELPLKRLEYYLKTHQFLPNFEYDLRFSNTLIIRDREGDVTCG